MNYRAFFIGILLTMVSSYSLHARYGLELGLTYGDYIQLSLAAKCTAGPITGKASIYYSSLDGAIKSNIKALPNYKNSDYHTATAASAAANIMIGTAAIIAHEELKRYRESQLEDVYAQEFINEWNKSEKKLTPIN